MESITHTAMGMSSSFQQMRRSLSRHPFRKRQRRDVSTSLDMTRYRRFQPVPSFRWLQRLYGSSGDLSCGPPLRSFRHPVDVPSSLPNTAGCCSLTCRTCQTLYRSIDRVRLTYRSISFDRSTQPPCTRPSALRVPERHSQSSDMAISRKTRCPSRAVACIGPPPSDLRWPSTTGSLETLILRELTCKIPRNDITCIDIEIQCDEADEDDQRNIR